MMMRELRCVSFTLLALLLSLGVGAQGKPLFRVGADTVSVDEFNYAYEKNRRYTTGGGHLSVEEFLQSYIDFRLKVADARASGLDTLPSFRQEFVQYRDYQITPYLLDSAQRESVYRETYLRMQREVDASHILIMVHEPEQEMRALERAETLRAAIAKGASFDSLAREHSDDPSAKKNGGRLGFFGAFTMVYPFESVAFHTSIGEVSPPVRTQFGYHIIRVNAVRRARGQMRVAHIMKMLPPEADAARVSAATQELELLRGEVLAGADFAELAAGRSDDRTSAEQGGVLPLVSVGRFPEAFVEAAFALPSDGALSPVVRSPYGVHLLKRLAHIPVGDYEASRGYIRSNLARVGIELEGTNALRRRFEQYSETHVRQSALERLAQFYEADTAGRRHPRLPDSLRGEWFAEVGGHRQLLDALHAKVLAEGTEVAFSRPNVLELARDVVRVQAEDETLRRLRRTHRELGYLLNEFYNGLLLFDVSERRLWTVNAETEKGLRSLYGRHKRDLRFKTRVTVEEYTSGDSAQLAAFRTFMQGHPSKGSLKKRLKADSVRLLTRNYEGDAPLLAGYGAANGGHIRAEAALRAPWDGALSALTRRRVGVFVFYRVVDVQADARKTFDEARGELQAMYQTEAERQWLAELRGQYTVEVFEEALAGLTGREQE